MQSNYPKPSVIIAAKPHDILISKLKDAGYEMLWITPKDENEWEAAITRATGMVVASGIKIDARFLDKSIRLKWVARLGSGMELIDVEEAKSRGIKVYSSPEGNANAVGEHALGMLLSLMHKITSSSLEIKNGQWIRDANRGIELQGKTVGIVGFGNTGKAFAKVLRGFDVAILAYDKYLMGFGNEYVKEVSFEQLLKYSDVVSLHLPLTHETFHLADYSLFKALERRPFFINTSRGEVLNTISLIEALEKGLISGAALDVLENEHLESYTLREQELLSTLLKRPEVLITPHIAGYSHEAFYKMSKIIADKLGL